jgi:hypothetical protein
MLISKTRQSTHRLTLPAVVLTYLADSFNQSCFTLHSILFHYTAYLLFESHSNAITCVPSLSTSSRLCCVLLPARRPEGIPDRHDEGGATHPLLLCAQGVGEDTGEDGGDGQRDNGCQEGESELESVSPHPPPPVLVCTLCYLTQSRAACSLHITVGHPFYFDFTLF